jgi:hypothetical protein
MDKIIDLLVDPFKNWLIEHKFEYFSKHAISLAAIFYSVIVFLFTRIKRYFSTEIKRKKLSKDLHPYYTRLEIRNAIRYYIPTKGQNVAPSRENEPRETHAFATKDKLIPLFLEKTFQSKNEDARYLIILADSGMGKTTFMINLYFKYIVRIFKKKYIIKLLPLGFLKIDEQILKINDKQNTILLLDAFDEDPKAAKDYKPRLMELIQNTQEFRKVLITCRTQFFPKEEEEPFETGIAKFGGEKGEYIFKKIYVSPFDDSDIDKYLTKKYGRLRFWNFSKKRKAKIIVRHSPNLMVRPMLLNYVDDFIKAKKKFKNSYELYEALIEKWIQREANRVSYKGRENFKYNLDIFSEEVSVDIFYNQEKRGGLFINSEEIEQFAQLNNVQLGTIDLKSRSLLNRDSIGGYKFSHKSILEFFLAKRALKSEELYNAIIKKLGFDQAKTFLKEALFETYTNPFFFNTHKEGSYSCDGLKYFGKNLNSLRQTEIKKIQYLYFDKIPYEIDLRSLEGLPLLSEVDVSLFNHEINSEMLFDKLTQHEVFFKIRFEISMNQLLNLECQNYINVRHLKIRIEEKYNSVNLSNFFEVLTKLANLNEFWIFSLKFQSILIDEKVFINLKNLRQINVQNISSSFRFLNMISNLEFLTIDASDFNEDFDFSNNLSTLKELSIVNTRFKKIGGLQNLTALESLSLNVINFNFEGLKNLINLKYIKLSGTGTLVIKQIKMIGSLLNLQNDIKIQVEKGLFHLTPKESLTNDFPWLNIEESA